MAVSHNHALLRGINAGKAKRVPMAELRALLAHGVFRVLPLESTGSLEMGAGHACLVETFRGRTLHPMDDAAELTTRVMALESGSGPMTHDVGQALRVAEVLSHVPVLTLSEVEPALNALQCLPADMAARLSRRPIHDTPFAIRAAISCPAAACDGDEVWACST